MMMYSYNENQLTVKNNNIDFLSSIEKIIEIDDKLLVLVKDKSTKKIKTQGNIYAINENAEIIWEIQASTPFDGWYRPFTGIYIRDDIAIAYSPLGIEYKINLDNGRLVDIPKQRPW